MFTSLKRVISNPDEIGSKESGKISKTDNDQQDSINTIEDNNGEAPMSANDVEQQQQQPPAIVEYDDDEANIFLESMAPTRLVDGNTNNLIASGSTLSDGFGEDSNHNMNDSAQQLGNPSSRVFVPRSSRMTVMPLRNNNNENNNNIMARPNSQLSTDSQSVYTRTSLGASSSRDASGNWGWFEDVHGVGGSSSDLQKIMAGIEQAGRDMNGINSSNNRTNNNRGGVKGNEEDEVLSRSVDNEAAAAMAVTAPTYVLEESLSSQKLWKNTAGTRPPQPVEERAFYEKMWAQNFSRSHVDYQVPVEVLTASSPINLSPFADGNFGDDGAYGHDGRQHLDGTTYSEQHHGAIIPQRKGDLYGTSSNTYDMADAALMYRLQDSTTMQDGATRNDDKRKIIKGTDREGDLTLLLKGDNVFGTTVSKSFPKSNDKGAPITGVDTINVSVASYRVVESKKHGKFAQYLVIYREGSIRDTVGVWKRYSDFVDLSRKVTASQEGCSSVLATMSPLHITEEHEVEHLPNAITSWSLIKKRQRWYRCLDAGYLSLKVFLLERFLHDILFESSNPKLIRDFALNPEALQD